MHAQRLLLSQYQLECEQARGHQVEEQLVSTKKRLALLQDTLTRFCYELEGISKQMVASRSRDVSLGRALREYGKRNRELQSGVVAARKQLQSVMSAFRSSERRNDLAIAANWSLKRDLGSSAANARICYSNARSWKAAWILDSAPRWTPKRVRKASNKTTAYYSTP